MYYMHVCTYYIIKIYNLNQINGSYKNYSDARHHRYNHFYSTWWNLMYLNKFKNINIYIGDYRPSGYMDWLPLNPSYMGSSPTRAIAMFLNMTTVLTDSSKWTWEWFKWWVFFTIQLKHILLKTKYSKTLLKEKIRS